MVKYVKRGDILSQNSKSRKCGGSLSDNTKLPFIKLMMSFVKFLSSLLEIQSDECLEKTA
jgi:hypothetical protein